MTVGRSSGDTHCDIADDTQLAQLWEQAGQVDAVVYTTLDELSSEDLESSLRQKALAQINLVRTGLEHVSTTGSFTLISGIPLHDPVVSGTAAAAANGVIKAFVRAAAVEIAPVTFSAAPGSSRMSRCRPAGPRHDRCPQSSMIRGVLSPRTGLVITDR
ncbi:hypothetical protein [Kocuria palustris]|uniref:hypothetical protein n=1 Tax=Kocuria palustris TaxID=71999 RepID=UPI00195B9CFE|nr:hypothetical protein [Kocuria palustris]